MKVGLIILFATMDLMALLLNLCILIVILKTPHLLQNLTNSFVLNLCSADLIAALVIVPIWITNYAAGVWISPESVCDMYGFTYAILSYETIWTICLISVERYYSIAYPMLHAANLTLSRSLVMIVSTWILSAFLAVLPVIYDQKSSSVYDVEGAICVNVFADTVDGNEQWILVGVICFCIPAAVVALVYARIFHIARRAQRQISPTLQDLKLHSDMDPTFVKRKASGERHRPSFQEAIFSNATRLSIIGTPNNGYLIEEYLETYRKESAKSSRSGRSFSREFLPKMGQLFRVGKAARTIIGVSGLFLVLWMPHFVVLFYGSVNPHMPNRETVEIVVTWLSFLTFIANPLLYGIYNRPIRRELGRMLRRHQKIASKEVKIVNEPPQVDEDFLQFLERTRGSDTPQIKRGSNSSAESNAQDRY